MSLRLGAAFPNFECETTQGRLKLHDYFGEGWGVLFSHPGDFTPVCTTELGTVSKYAAEFDKRDVKVRRRAPAPCPFLLTIVVTLAR